MNRALCLLVLAAACGNTASIDPLERQPKYKPYAANPFFEDGRAMRSPPANTVPRERIVQKPELTSGKDANGEVLNAIPVPITRTLMDHGRKNFEIHCATCHGLLGDGVSLVATQMSLRPPPSLLRTTITGPGHVYQVISGGYGLMGSYAAELTPEERWGVVAYIKALQRSQSATLADAPPDVRAQLAKESP
jgi:mono/diheme cytochrome c family protein